MNAIRARPISTDHLPIHLLLRIALECTSVRKAILTFERLGGPASSQHILIADAESGSRGLELSPRGSVYLSPDAHGILIHTNHFLKNKLVDEPPWLSGSPLRLRRARDLSEAILREDDTEVTPELLRERIFSDTVNAPQAIRCGLEGGKDSTMATLFNIIMTFERGTDPTAEVVFGKPGADNHGPIYRMPW